MLFVNNHVETQGEECAQETSLDCRTPQKTKGMSLMSLSLKSVCRQMYDWNCFDCNDTGQESTVDGGRFHFLVLERYFNILDQRTNVSGQMILSLVHAWIPLGRIFLLTLEHCQA